MADDPFALPPVETEPPRFDDAVRAAVERLQAAVTEFDGLLQAIPSEAFTEAEWKVVDAAAGEIEKSAEMAEEGYIAAMYDSHAWYRIMEHLERVATRLESATGVMRGVRERVGKTVL
jgi:hypothetical protein